MGTGVSLEFKNCSLYINGLLVEKDDALISLASELTLGVVPQKIKDFYLEEDDLSKLERLLANEIFGKGNCLTPDLDFIDDFVNEYDDFEDEF